MGLLLNKALFVDGIPWFGESPGLLDKYNVLFDELHLGVQTNIVCIDDRPRDYERFKEATMPQDLGWAGDLPAYMHDVTATLYLGKIIFEKNKDGNFAPKYIPSHISESSFEGLNTFWLNEINPNALPKPDMPDPDPDIFIDGPPLPNIDPEGYKYLKNFYFRSPQNITLNKEQIISYFSELHTLNTTFIKNYIDSINQAQSIKAYHLHDALYDELLKKGILRRSMFEWYRNGVRSFALPQAKLFALDYLKKTGANSAIAYYDELFYYYFFASLSNFVVHAKTGSFCEKNGLLFNIGAYRKYSHLLERVETSSVRNPKTKKFEERIRISFNHPLYAGESFWGDEIMFFGNDVGFIFVVREPDTLGFKSPNPVLNDTLPPIYAPSPLGHYYFELTDNLNTFVEYYPRIYPSITTPPKGWNKEMMKKLELTLE